MLVNYEELLQTPHYLHKLDLEKCRLNNNLSNYWINKDNFIKVVLKSIDYDCLNVIYTLVKQAN